MNNISRDNWAENIQQVISKNQDTNDEAILEDLLNDSDLEEFKQKDGLILLDQIRTVNKRTSINISKILVQILNYK